MRLSITFDPSKLPDFPPVKACKRCRDELARRRETLGECLASKVVTEEAAKAFVEIAAAGPEGDLSLGLSAFVAALAMHRVRGVRKSAREFVTTYLRTCLASVEKLEKSIEREVPEVECQIHNGQSDDDSPEFDSGPVPPDASGLPDMYGRM